MSRKILFQLLLKDHELQLDLEDKLMYGQSAAWMHESNYVRVYHGGKDEYLHRLIMNPGDKHVDHIDGNPKNNCKSNLRLVTRSQNMANSVMKSGNTSGYKGVVLSKGKYWTAGIMHNRKQIHLGNFKTPELAAAAYNRKALELHGEFALLNKLPESEIV